MKRRKSDLSKNNHIQTLDLLYTAAGTLRGREAVKAFLRDLLTESERIMMGRRIWIARLLLKGERPTTIAAELNVGRSTIWRVEQWLHDHCPGYEQAIEGLEKEMDKRALQKERSSNPFSYAALKHRYPLHFLFFPEPKPKKKYRS